MIDRLCPKCGVVIPVMDKRCKPCMVVWNSEYKLKNKERLKAKWDARSEDRKRTLAAKTLRWRINNPEKAKAMRDRNNAREKAKPRTAEWLKEKAEKSKEKDRKYLAVNREKHRDLVRSYDSTHPLIRLVCGRNRRARQKHASGSHSGADITRMMLEQRGKCANLACLASIDSKGLYHVDHVIALAIGGTNGPDNLQLLCNQCNRRKYTKTPEQWAKENGVLF